MLKRYLLSLMSCTIVCGCASANSAGGAKLNTSAPTARFSDKSLVFVVDSEFRMTNPNRRINKTQGGQGRNDQILFALVVDESGRVEMPTVSVLNDAPADMKSAMCKFLVDAHFEPYRVNDVPVRVLTLIMFGLFTTAGPRPAPSSPVPGPKFDWAKYRAPFHAESPDATIARLNARPHCN